MGQTSHPIPEIQSTSGGRGSQSHRRDPSGKPTSSAASVAVAPVSTRSQATPGMGHRSTARPMSLRTPRTKTTRPRSSVAPALKPYRAPPGRLKPGDGRRSRLNSRIKTSVRSLIASPSVHKYAQAFQGTMKSDLSGCFRLSACRRRFLQRHFLHPQKFDRLPLSSRQAGDRCHELRHLKACLDTIRSVAAKVSCFSPSGTSRDRRRVRCRKRSTGGAAQCRKARAQTSMGVIRVAHFMQRQQDILYGVVNIVRLDHRLTRERPQPRCDLRTTTTHRRARRHPVPGSSGPPNLIVSPPWRTP